MQGIPKKLKKIIIIKLGSQKLQEAEKCYNILYPIHTDLTESEMEDSIIVILMRQILTRP